MQPLSRCHHHGCPISRGGHTGHSGCSRQVQPGVSICPAQLFHANRPWLGNVSVRSCLGHVGCSSNTSLALAIASIRDNPPHTCPVVKGGFAGIISPSRCVPTSSSCGSQMLLLNAPGLRLRSWGGPCWSASVWLQSDIPTCRFLPTRLWVIHTWLG